MAATFSQILDEAKDAYLAILQRRVASYSLDSVTYTYHDLEKLHRVIMHLEKVVSRSGGDRPFLLLADISGRPG